MKLVIEDEVGIRSIVPFVGDEIVVGRGSDGVTSRLADRNVSRRHARFVLQNGSAFVEDLGSLTGTRVNGERIAGRRKLRAGDLVQIGDFDLAVLAEDVALDAAPPPPLPAPQPAPDPVASAERPVAPAVATAASEEAAREPRAAGSEARLRVRAIAIAAVLLALAAGLALLLR